MIEAFHVLWDYRAAFVGGIGVTASLLGLSMAIGTAVGIVIALAARSEPLGLLRDMLNGMSFISTAIPALVILFWVHYPAQALFNVRLSGFTSAAITLCVLNSLAVYRMIQEALESFPDQYISAARVSGLSNRTTIRRIYVPIILRAIAPRWIDQQVFILHCTLLASFVSVEEVFRISQRINSEIYHPVIIYTAMGLLFLIFAGSALQISKILKIRYLRDWSER